MKWPCSSGAIVPIVSLGMMSIRESALWARAAGARLDTSTPAPAASVVVMNARLPIDGCMDDYLNASRRRTRRSYGSGCGALAASAGCRMILYYHMMRAALVVPFARSQSPEISLHGRIVHAIGRRIVSGDLRPGDLLPSEPELGASRTVVREVVKVLSAKGLVESRPKTGTRVRPRETWNLLDPDVLAWHQGGSTGSVNATLLWTLTAVR